MNQDGTKDCNILMTSFAAPSQDRHTVTAAFLHRFHLADYPRCMALEADQILAHILLERSITREILKTENLEGRKH